MQRAFFLVLAAAITVGSCFAQQPRVLVFSKTNGYRHASIEAGVAALQQLGEDQGFTVEHTEDSTRFSESGLAAYDAVVFLSTTGNVFGPDEEAAFEQFIRSGKGFVGIHAAADTEYEWPFYRELVGRQFVQHPKHQHGRIHTIPADWPAATAGFGDTLTLYEEWYEYTVPYSTTLTNLMRIDTTTYQTGGHVGKEQMGVFHPLCWYQEHAGGRAFYTGIGHMEATYELPAFLDHLAVGIRWAATGVKE